METEEGNVSAISVGCLNIKSEGMSQIFLVNDDGTITSDNQLHCIENGDNEMVESQEFPIYDIGGQHFILDGESRMQLLHDSNDGAVFFAESEDPSFQELHQVEELKYAVDENMDLSTPAEDLSEAVTQITLDEEQCRQLEQHGRILLQHDNHHYLLDRWGLHDVTGDIDTVEEINTVLSEDKVILPVADDDSDEVEGVQYESMETETAEDVLTTSKVNVSQRHTISLLDQSVKINIEDSKADTDLVANEDLSKSDVDHQNSPLLNEESPEQRLTLHYGGQVTLVPKTEAIKSHMKIIGPSIDAVAITKEAMQESEGHIDTEYFVTVSNIVDSAEGKLQAVDSILVEMPSNKLKGVSKNKMSSKSVLQSSVTQGAKPAFKNKTSTEVKVLNLSELKADMVECASLPPIMKKYLQASSNRKEQLANKRKEEASKKTVGLKFRHVQKLQTRSLSHVDTVPSRFVASESLQSCKKELQLFTSQYGISWRDDTDSLKLKLTFKLPPGICDLKNKKIPIGPTKTGKRFIGKILSVVRPQNASHCRSTSQSNEPTNNMMNGKQQETDDAALEETIKSVLSSPEKDCTGEDLASTEKILESLMRVNSVSSVMADRDVAVIKVAMKMKAGTVTSRIVKSVVCGRMGIFSEPSTDQLEWKFMYMPDLLKRRNCTDGEGVDEFEVTADGVPYRRNPTREGDGDSKIAKRPSDRPLLQVRILETVDENNAKDSNIVIVETLPGNKQNTITGTPTTLNGIPRPIVMEDDMGRSYQCAMCTKVYGTMLQYTKHLSTEHRIKWVSCCYCNKMFNRPSNLQRHLRIHSNAGHSPLNNSSNESPEASVDSPPSLEENADDSKGITSAKKRNIYKCELCPCSYYYSSTLTRHIINSHILSGTKAEASASASEDLKITCSCTVLPHPHSVDNFYHKMDLKGVVQ